MLFHLVFHDVLLPTHKNPYSFSDTVSQYINNKTILQADIFWGVNVKFLNEADIFLNIYGT